MTVKFTSKNTTTAPTLNVNNTGAKPIKDFNGNDLDSDAYNWPEGAAMSFTYDGTSWRLQDSDLMERVHSAETKIEQNAEDIALRATKEEVNNAIDDVKITKSICGRSIVTEDAANLSLLDLNIYGECEQNGAPTPDAPVEIRSVRGRNLIPNTFDYSTTTNNVTCKRLDDGGIHLYGTASAQTEFYISRVESNRNVVKVPAGTYTFSARGLVAGVHAITSGGGTGYNGFPYQDFNGMDKSATGTVTAGENPLHYIILRIAANTTVDTVVYLQFEAGTLTPYVPYGCIGVKTTGKNRFDSSNLLRASGWSENSGVYSGTIQNLYSSSPFPIAPVVGEFKVSFDFRYTTLAAASGNGISIAIKKADGTTFPLKYTGVVDTKTHYEFTYSSDQECVTVGFGYVKAGTIELSNFQIERGTEATDYEPYRESISYIDLKGEELCSLPDGTEDVLTVDASGHVKIKKSIGHHIVTENERYVDHTADSQPHISVYDTADNKSRVDSGYCELSDKYISRFSNASGSFYPGGKVGGGFTFANTAFTDATTAMQLLAGVNVYYPLATPQIIDLGYIDLPTTFPNGTVHVEAEIQPQICGS